MKTWLTALLFTLKHDTFRAAEEGELSVKNTGWMNVNCLEMLLCRLTLLCNHSEKAAVLAGSSICPLCFAFTGHRRAGGEGRESVRHVGQRCCRHPRRGITAHITARFTRRTPGCINNVCAFHRCARQLSSGNSQRNFMQLLMRYWQIPFQQWVQLIVSHKIKVQLLICNIENDLMGLFVQPLRAKHPGHRSPPGHRLPALVCR